MLTLHPPGFIETESCDGPRYTRGQPSRENTGVTMTEIQDKYIPEFELPYRNVMRYIKEVENNWNRLDEDQRNSIRKSFDNMNIGNKVENFNNGELFEVMSKDNSIKYIFEKENNINKLLNISFKPTIEERERYNITDEKLKSVRNSLYNWSLENTFLFHYNWKSGLASFLMIILILLIGIFIGNMSH
jgi:hypothetical protein